MKHAIRQVMALVLCVLLSATAGLAEPVEAIEAEGISSEAPDAPVPEADENLLAAEQAAGEALEASDQTRPLSDSIANEMLEETDPTDDPEQPQDPDDPIRDDPEQPQDPDDPTGEETEPTDTTALDERVFSKTQSVVDETWRDVNLKRSAGFKGPFAGSAAA